MPARFPTDINQFLQRKQPQWRRLEALLQRIEADGLLALPPVEIREFGVLYRRASSDLVSARAKTANAELLEYLNDLVARSYAQVYRTRRYRVTDVWSFITCGFPCLVRHHFRYIAAAAAITLSAVLFGFVMERRDPAAAFYLLPAEQARSIPEMRERWSHRTGHDVGPAEMGDTSGQILTNNIGVAFMAFAAGISLGVGTVLLLLFNGFMLGILGGAMSHPATAVTFWSLILPHGIIEFAAIFIAGGAGLMIGSALLAPGRRTRRDALMECGRHAVLLVLGTIPMFICAGLIEGYITPPWWIPPYAKLAFAGLTLLLLTAYLAIPGRQLDASAEQLAAA